MGRASDNIGGQSSHKKDVCGQTIWYLKGKPRLGWIDCPDKDLKTINIRNWKRQAKNGTAWNGILRKAKARDALRLFKALGHRNQDFFRLWSLMQK
ncbi:hypothetical protein TNCV_2794541 [Trichonephila clavipes]|nr:hypothetical protein TNCV_2794541 [Trichonephila clavipes]